MNFAAKFGTPKDVDEDVMFASSFGSMVKHKQEYYNPFTGTDLRKDIASHLIQKGPSINTGTGGAGTAGFAMIPVFVIPEVVDRTQAQTPLVALTPRRANRGMTHDYNALTAKGGANFRIEDGGLPEDIDTYTRESVSIKFGYSVGRLTGPALAGWATTGRGDGFAADLAVKTTALRELEENTIINGDATTNTEEYDGFIQTITTNSTALGGVAVSLADIRAEFATTFNAFGFPTLCVTDASTHNSIKSLLQDFQRQPAPPAEGLRFGIPGAFFFDQANFIKSTFMPTSGAARRILFLDPRYYYLAVLQEVTFQEIPSLNDSRKYMLKVYEALVVTYEGAMAQITGIL